MRKVIILILFTFLLVPLYKVKAIDTFDLPINQNINIKKVAEKYKWYKLNEVDSRNEDVFEHICEYLELKETDYSSWSTEKPESKYGRIIEEKEETSSDEVEYYYLMIDNILVSNLRTFEIKLYDDNYNEIEYRNVFCYNCTSIYPYENLYDNSFRTYFEVKFNQPLTFVLKEPTTKNVRVQFFYDKEDYLFGYRISKLDQSFNIIESREENTSTLVNLSSGAYSSYINSRNNNWSNSTSTKYYRYKDAYLICYEKEYLDDYYENVDNYIKDENRSIKSYEYDIVEPEIIEKEVFKQVFIPEEKVIYKYVENNNSNDSCEYVSSQKVDNREEQESSTIISNNDKKITKRDIKFYVIFSIILLLIILLCLFIKELINKCR